MAQTLLNSYLPGLWANMSDEKIIAMCTHIKKIVDYIEHGTEVDGQSNQGQ